jgi:hypothetical protein
MTLENLRFQVGAGDGLVARSGGRALVVPRWSTDQTKVLDELIGVVEGGQTGEPVPSRLLARRVAGILTQEEPEGVPAFAALFSTEDGGLALIIHGDVEVTVTTDGRTETLSGRHVATWVDQVLHEPIDSVLVQAADAGAPAPPPRFDLRGGVVPAGALLLTRAPSGAEPAAAPPPAPPAAPAPAPAAAPASEIRPPPSPAAAEPVGAYRPISLREDGPHETRPPLPLASEPPAAEPDTGPAAVIVEGIACSRGHFNHPDARFCSSCGIGMVHMTHNVIEGKRPPLGVLLLDDGTTFSLSTDVVIGRAPESHPAVASGKAQPLVVDDEERSLSRIHAFVELSGWDVRMKDCGSANGTAVQQPGEADWALLAADVPTTLADGARVRLGKRTFVYDARHRR